ncbi:MAG: DNA mismatch repair protein [Bacteroidales bacterium]|jgi:DNA mismatch repair ATPase MutS
MIFKIDKQTIDDLGIFGKIRENSVYGVFNKTMTHGGAQILEQMFMYPLSEENKINERGMIIRYFQNNLTDFPFRSDLFDSVEFYLNNTDSRSRLSAYQDNLERKFKNVIGTDVEYKLINKGVQSVIEILVTLNQFLTDLKKVGIEKMYQPQVDAMEELLNINGLKECLKETNYKKLSYAKTAVYDQEFRYNFRDKLKLLLHYIYNLDVYISVAKVSRERNFAYATALPPEINLLEMEDVYHPLLKNPVGNSIKVDGTNNMIFLTGANMAGKSTFMKTFGIAVYLAHMGFPVPAANMKFSVQNGMFTTINLPDNMNKGYSHFYAEVMRVKKVAESVGGSKNLIVIFDELFRGTNVKDAYDATVAVTEALAGNRNCIFIISTHIIEAGETLRDRCNNINFINLPTVMDGTIPRYTYKIAPGITSDRHGMIIINNEGILDILKR